MFQATTSKDVVELVRDEAALLWRDRALRAGERDRPRADGLASEFSDAAFGVAAEVASAVGEALRASGRPFHPALAWDAAAALLRNGWKRGHRILPHVIGKGVKA